MAGNDWINSYLEAILDVGPAIDDPKSSLLLRERGHFSPSRYFVEEVITGFDETDLYKSWARASATRSPQERNTRLENLCWRIWNLARQKKQIEEHVARKEAQRHVEREKGRRDATADMSEDLSEGEKGDGIDLPSHGDSARPRMPRISSVDMMAQWASQYRDKKLYIVLISLHGLIRGENMELGRDSDTGGQVKYVVELARALAASPGVYRVDLLTRQVSAPDVDWSYGEPTEMLNVRSTDNDPLEVGESSGAYIVRIPFGPRNKYVPKESLWPHISEFVDGALSHILHMSKALGEQIGSGQPVWPAIIHGHYADAGDSAALLSGALNVPMVFTGHSLGRDKLLQLLKQKRASEQEIDNTYKISRRIEAEELCLDISEIIITSTRQEIEEQWSMYDGFDLVLERKLRARMRRGVSCLGRFMPRLHVIPPGMEFNHIVPPDGDMDADIDGEVGKKATDPKIWSQIMRFFTNRRKPMILALARPDPKKNLTTLVKAFGECQSLRELANLTLIMGNREDIDEMSTTNGSVLISILKLIDKYDLYGHVAYPKHHQQSEVADIYRLAAKTKGVFINPAFIEPFGLTLIEAAAYGLPIVATKNGGPVDIIKTLDNGLLIDPHDQQSISDALLKLVADKHQWGKCRQNGLKNIHLYSWTEHCKRYLSRIASCKPRQPNWQGNGVGWQESEADSPSDSLGDIQNLSLNLNVSLEGEKNEGGSTNLDESLESDGSGSNKIEKAVSKLSKHTKKVKVDGANASLPTLRRRKCIIVVAVDCDASSGLLDIVKTILQASGEQKTAGSVGYVVCTALTISEIHSVLTCAGLSPTDFDAFICNSGSELYYPSAENSAEFPFVQDEDYHSHIEYRWGGDGLKKTLVRWATEKNKEGSELLVSDEARCTDYCYAFKVNDLAKLPSIKELRKLLRIRALRCHAIYCQNGSRLNVIPVLASRSQALRFLFIRWGAELSKFVVFVGESGDTDYEGLLGGVHKTVVLKGVCAEASKLHTNRKYPLEHVVPYDSPNMVQTERCTVEEIKSSFGKLGILRK